jgi:hypothetical protein
MNSFSIREQRLIGIVILTIFVASLISPPFLKAQSNKVKALVGGTLIDGYRSAAERGYRDPAWQAVEVKSDLKLSYSLLANVIKAT